MRVDRPGKRWTLSPLMAEIAECAGTDAAQALARARGGTEVYIPKRANDDHWLVACVGRAAADKIVRLFGDCRLTVPMAGNGRLAEGQEMAADMLRNGVPHREIAQRVGIHTRTVRRINARMNCESTEKAEKEDKP